MEAGGTGTDFSSRDACRHANYSGPELIGCSTGPNLRSPFPGYGGFCPQYKYSMGQTYGKGTSQLLTNPDINHSDLLVLQSTLPPPKKDEGTRTINYFPRNRRHQLCDKKLSIHVIPGYTGFIPRAQNHFAKTYMETSRDALTDFELDQLQMAAQTQELFSRNVLKTEQQQLYNKHQKEVKNQLLSAKYRTPLQPIAKDCAPYISPQAYQHQDSPYCMESEDPNKYFISGFTGYVPRARFMIGAGYPNITNRAMVEFGDMTLNKTLTDGRLHQLSQLHSKSLPELSKIYPVNMGLIPRYTGFVPGYKYQFGHTYGQLTKNALGITTAEKQAVD